MFSVLNEIKDNSPKRVTSVIGASIGSAAFVYVLVAITGYLSFGNNVAGNIIGMYIPSVASTIGKAAIVILVMFSYPLQVHPCRASVSAVLKWRPASMRRSTPVGSPSRNGLLTNTQTKPVETIGELKFAVITTVIIVLSYIVAMTVSSLDRVLAYVGSTGSTSISFILPGLFYYKISAPESIHHQRLLRDEDEEEGIEDGEEGDKKADWRRPLLRKMSLALAIYGVCVMVLCLGMNLLVSGGVSH